MATDIPTPGGMVAELLIGLAGSGISAILNAFHKGGAAAAVQSADTLAIALIQKTAEIKGLTIDWTDPIQVAAYVAGLQPFVPIPEPSAPVVQGKSTTAPPAKK
jgi:hypothetical protein